jgi:hypothetical protein
MAAGLAVGVVAAVVIEILPENRLIRNTAQVRDPDAAMVWQLSMGEMAG